MRTCLNLVTLRQGLDPLEGIKLAAAAEFEGVGIWADSFESTPNPLAFAADVAQALRDHNLRAEEMCFVGGWMWAQGQDRSQAFDVIRRRVELAAAATCPVIIACASGGRGELAAAVEDFRAICDIGQSAGVTMALEYIGMFEQIKDLPSGLEIVRLANHPYGKLLIDTFHTFRGGSTLEDFDLPTGDEVGCVHINDVPAGDVLQMVDADRVMPGAGVLPLREALGKLQRNGYTGALSVEIFNQEWWSRSMEETARAAREGLVRVMP